MIAPVATAERLAAAEAQGVDLATVDQVLADTAATQPFKELAQVVDHYLACLDPDGPEPDPTEGRWFTIVRHADGSVSGRFDLDAVGGEKVAPCWSRCCRPTGLRATASRGQQWVMRSCSGPTTPWPRATCRSCAPSSRTWRR